MLLNEARGDAPRGCRTTVATKQNKRITPA